MATIRFEIPDERMQTYRELVQGSLHVGYGHVNFPWQWGGPDESEGDPCPHNFTRELVIGLVEGYLSDSSSNEEFERLKANGIDPEFKTIKDAKPPDKEAAFDYNPDLKRRAEILGISPKARFRPRCPIFFKPLHFSRLDSLVEERFIDLDEQPPMNNPSNGEFFALVKDHPSIHVSGHAYNPDPDSSYTGIHLTGICIPDQMYWGQDDKTAFIRFCVTADELEIGTKFRAWWD